MIKVKFKFDSININNLNFSYDEQKNVFNKNIKLTIKKGEIIGIFGKSGSGKVLCVNN